MHAHKARCWLLTLLCALVVTGCDRVPTYQEVQATAQVAGCWPDMYPTPQPITVTPRSPLSPVLPTTTPYPRCPPRPGETAKPWPTPVPPPPPYPTMEPRLWQGGSAERTTMQLPGRTFSLDLAVHPTEGWPVVATTQRAFGAPLRVYVRVYHPQAHTWGVAQQVDIGASSLGTDRFNGVAVGITGDHTVYVAWGASDRALNSDGSWASTPDIWASTSSDYGATWSAPQRIAQNCWAVLDLATDTAGDVVVLANCFARAGGSYVGQATFITRHAGQDWQEAERLNVAATFGSVAIAGSGAEVRAVALVTPFHSGSGPRYILLSKRLSGNGTWDVQMRDGNAPWHLRSLAFARPRADGRVEAGVIFVGADYPSDGIFALTSRDGGQSWGALEPIAAPADAVSFVTPAYDPAADRLLALYGCCGDTLDDTTASTHYASWRAPERGSWQALSAPLASGALSVRDTASAQAFGSRTIWLAWFDGRKQVQVRSLDLNTVLPHDQYPTSTPVATEGDR